mmetsp:Transcript_10104/g.27509  ORF Transcript_10104/g.27509 Transcript_10104/m.27509 type:complete len:245 (-) Transcript_10104:1255-1989(-)
MRPGLACSYSVTRGKSDLTSSFLRESASLRAPGSTPSTTTCTASPALHPGRPVLARRRASAALKWSLDTRPSTEGPRETMAPNSPTFLTVPVRTSPGDTSEKASTPASRRDDWKDRSAHASTHDQPTTTASRASGPGASLAAVLAALPLSRPSRRGVASSESASPSREAKDSSEDAAFLPPLVLPLDDASGAARAMATSPRLGTVATMPACTRVPMRPAGGREVRRSTRSARMVTATVLRSAST